MTSAVETATSSVEPGIYFGMSFDDYAAIDAVNQSLLNQFRKTPKHAEHYMKTGGKSTKAMEFGWLVHLATFEPERFGSEIVTAPKLDKRTKKGKESWASFQEDHGDKTIVDAESFDKCSAISGAVHGHESAHELLTGDGRNELTVVWDDSEHGVLCKGRLDRATSANGWPVVVDLKTARDASPWGFQRSFHSYGYHVQGAHYLTGIEALYPTQPGNPYRRYIIIAVESEPPHAVAVYDVDDEALEQGAKDREKYIRQYKTCMATNRWPDWGPGALSLDLPPYAYKRWELD